MMKPYHSSESMAKEYVAALFFCDVVIKVYNDILSMSTYTLNMA